MQKLRFSTIFWPLLLMSLPVRPAGAAPMALPAVASATGSCCGSMMGEDGGGSGNPMMGRGMGHGMMGHGMPGWMMTPGAMGMDARMMQDMPVIHGLLMSHARIQRKVEDLPDGVRTLTTSQDPDVADLIRTHVWQMKERIEKGLPIRQMDPLFREIFLHHNQVKMVIENVPGGVRVQETSKDPQVVLLIRQHAHKAVSEFVEYGMPRAMQPTALPKGYRPPSGP